MPNQVQGEIDINPPLAWSEVQPTGFMLPDVNGFPVTGSAGGNLRLVTLPPVETLVERPEGILHKFLFPTLAATSPDIATEQRELFRAQLAEIVAAFPTHTFGGVNRVVRFRGDLLDDMWRARLNTDNTVRLQTAALTWTDT
jgi:hypothetical protein